MIPSKSECMPISNDYASQILSTSKRLSTFVVSRYRECVMCKKYTFHSIMIDYLNKTYRTSRNSYNVKVINDIIYNENTHIVSIFKDYLIFDDVSEFMRRFYSTTESSKRLPKIYEFYDKYSKVFPNYVVIPESKFMFKNIEKKQKLIDEQQKQSSDTKKRKPDGNSDEEDNKIFDSSFLNKLNKAGSTLDPSLSAQSQLHSYIKNTKPRNDTNNSFQELIEKVLSKDSLSFYQEKQGNQNPDKRATNSKQADKAKQNTKDTDPKKLLFKKEELKKEIKIQLQPNKKGCNVAPHPLTTRELMITNKVIRTEDKKNGFQKDAPMPRKAETPLKLFANKDIISSTPIIRDSLRTDSKLKTKNERNIVKEQKRAYSSNKSPKSKLKDVDFQKMMNNIKMLKECPSNRESATTKHLSVEPKTRHEKLEMQSRNPNPPQQSCTNRYPNLNEISNKYKCERNNFILDIDISNKALINSSRKPNVETTATTGEKKMQQYNHHSNNITPEITNKKVESFFNAKQSKNQNIIRQPQTVKALLEPNRMLFSKSVASVEKAKSKLESCQSDKKETNNVKAASKKVMQKNMFTANVLKQHLTNSKK